MPVKDVHREEGAAALLWVSLRISGSTRWEPILPSAMPEPHARERVRGRGSSSPCDGHCRLLLGAHGDAALQVVELAKVLPQRAAALEVPGHVDGALEGREEEEEEEAALGTGPRSRVTRQAGRGACLIHGETCRQEGTARAGHRPAPPGRSGPAGRSKALRKTPA